MYEKILCSPTIIGYRKKQIISITILHINIENTDKIVFNFLFFTKLIEILIIINTIAFIIGKVNPNYKSLPINIYTIQAIKKIQDTILFLL